MTRRLLLLAPVALLCVVAISCSTFSVAAATVNGQKITESEVEAELDRVRGDPTFQDLLQRQADQLRGVARRNILTGLIRQAVLQQQAQRMHIHVTRAQVDRLIREEAGRQGMSVEKFSKSQNLSEADARKIGERIVRLFEIRRRVTDSLGVDESALRSAYESQRSSFVDVHLWRITVRTREDARRALERLGQGNDFADVARARSIDNLADKGGDLGYVALTSLNSQVQAALDRASVGGVTDPIQTAAGFEIYRASDRRTQPFEDVRAELRAQLSDQTREGQFQEWLARRVRAARVVVNPKYGRFDRSQLQVVPGTAALRP